MADASIHNTVSEIIRELFDEYEGPVAPELTAADVPQWDSLAHVQLLVMVEQSFDIQFTTIEIDQLKNLGDLFTLIESKKR